METREWRTATAEWVENYKNSLGGNNNENNGRNGKTKNRKPNYDLEF